MCVILPKPNFIAWKKTIQGILSKDKTKSNNLETLIGRLNHKALVIPLSRHLHTRIRCFHSNINVFAWYKLRTNIRDYLKLHMKILHLAHKIISMNLLIYHKPTCIYLADACKIVMGGFSSKGRAGRWQIPKEYWGRAHINLLKFYTKLVSRWIGIL